MIDYSVLGRSLEEPRPRPEQVEPIVKAAPKPKRTGKPMRRRALKTGTRPVTEWSTDADYEMARRIVAERSGGKCEHCRTADATNVHHKAGRGFAGCHHPMLLIALCGNGNIDGCHGLAHQMGATAAMALGLRLPKGTTANDLEGVT